MPAGSLSLHITDLLDAPASGAGLEVSFAPASGSAGGASVSARFTGLAETDFTVEGIPCRGGPGTLYRVDVEAANFRRFAFFQTISEGGANKPPESHFRLVADPKKVKDIHAPDFARLPPAAQDSLSAARMLAPADEDRDLRGLQGAALYGALGPLRKACLLNIFKKASHGTADRCVRFLREILVIRQDRFFCMVDSQMGDFLRRSDVFKSAPNVLHQPLAGFERSDSFKSKDAHANIQVTLMRHKQSGEFAADVDLDESSGFEHGFEVIRNSLKGRTNPFLMRELLLLVDPLELTLNPGYTFVFKGAGKAGRATAA